MRKLGLAGIIFVTAVIGFSGADATTTTASKLLESCLSAASMQQTVHTTTNISGTTLSATAGRKASLILENDAGVGKGIQRITFRQSGTVGHEIVELLGGIAYLKADAFTLRYFNGFSSAKAVKLSNVWMSVVKSDEIFRKLVGSLTIASNVGDLRMSSPELLHSATVQSVSVNRFLSHSSSASIELACARTGKQLPVEQFVSYSKSGSRIAAGTTTFDRWGQSLRVVVPQKSVRLDSNI